MEVSSTVAKIVAIAVGLFVAAIIVPVAMVTMANATWSGSNGDVDASVVTIMTILVPVLAAVGIALYFLRSD